MMRYLPYILVAAGLAVTFGAVVLAPAGSGLLWGLIASIVTGAIHVLLLDVLQRRERRMVAAAQSEAIRQCNTVARDGIGNAAQSIRAAAILLLRHTQGTIALDVDGTAHELADVATILDASMERITDCLDNISAAGIAAWSRKYEGQL